MGRDAKDGRHSRVSAVAWRRQAATGGSGFRTRAPREALAGLRVPRSISEGRII